MSPPRGRFGNRLDTAAGRAKEAQMEAAAAAQAAQAAMRVAQAEAAAGRAAEAARAAQAAQAAAQRAAPVVQQAVAAHTQQLATGASGAPPVPQLAAPAPAPAAAPAAAAPSSSFTPVTTPAGGREVSLDYARQVEQRVNDLLAQGNIDGALAQARNITGGGPGVQNALNRINAAISAASSARDRVRESEARRTETPETPVVPKPGRDSEPRTLVSTQTKRTYGGKVQVIAYYSDGTTQVVDEWVDKAAGEAAADMFRAAGLDPAFVNRLMATIDNVYNTSINPSEGQILNAIYNSDAYKQRFKANEKIRQRIADGQGRPGDRLLSPKEYIDLENTYRNILQERSMPEGFYDSPDDFTNLIANSISASEFTSRVDTAASALNQADPAIVNSLQRFYNLTKSDLVAYLLDPTRAMPVLNARSMQGAFGLNSADQLRRIYESSEVGGMAERQNLGIERTMAEEIVDLGKKNQADEAFQMAGAADNDLQRLGSLYGGALDFKDLVKETLNLSGGVESGRRRRKFASKERAAFSAESALDTKSLRRMQDL